jgi:hypothetical protein
MRKILLLTAMAGIALVASSAADARGGPGGGGPPAVGLGGPGASDFAPGHRFREPGAVSHPGYPGASYYAPGRTMLRARAQGTTLYLGSTYTPSYHVRHFPQY